MDPKRRVLVLIAVLAAVAAAVVGPVACTSGTTPNCSDAQCGAPSAELEDSGQDGADALSETGPDVAPDTTSPDAPPPDAGEAGEAGEGGKGAEAGDAPPGDAPTDGNHGGDAGEAGPKDAASDG